MSSVETIDFCFRREGVLPSQTREGDVFFSILIGSLLPNVIFCSACEEELIGKDYSQKIIEKFTWKSSHIFLPDSVATFFLFLMQ